jgi:D-alanyl-D-alanine carboxypeptidase
MAFLSRTVSRGLVLTLIIVLGSSCSSPAYRDFAAVSGRALGDRAIAGPKLIDPAGDAPVDIGPMLALIGERTDIPGFAAAVLHGDRVVAQGVAGVRRRGFDAPVTINDQFHIASCAKAMSALLVARLVEKGTLQWDRPVSRYFPDKPHHPDWDAVTLQQLLSHTAGLRDPLLTFLGNTYFERGSLTERRLAFVEKVLRSKPSSPPGTRMVYCNTDYIVAAAVAEKVTGQSWERLMMNTVFAPLGLESAGYGPPGVSGQVLQPWGHGKHRLMQVGVAGYTAFDPEARAADYPAMASPAGYVHLSIRDWVKFVSVHLRAHPANPNRQVAVLGPDVFDTLYELRSGVAYTAGWFVGTRPWAKGSRAGDMGRVLYHEGDNGRWTSAVWVAPEIDFAVVVTCNRGDMSAAVDEAVSRLVSTYARSKPLAAR